MAQMLGPRLSRFFLFTAKPAQNKDEHRPESLSSGVTTMLKAKFEE